MHHSNILMTLKTYYDVMAVWHGDSRQVSESLSGGKGYLFVILQPFFFFFFLRAAVAVIGLQILATFPNISQTLVAKVNKVLSTIVRRLAQLTVWQTCSEKLVRVERYFFTTDEGLSLLP